MATTEVHQELSFTNLSIFSDEASFLSQYEGAMQNRTGLNGVHGVSINTSIDIAEIFGQISVQTFVSTEDIRKTVAIACTVPETSVTMFGLMRRLSNLRQAKDRHLMTSYSYAVALRKEGDVDLVAKVKQVQQAAANPAILEAAANQVTNSIVSLSVEKVPSVKLTAKVVIIAPAVKGTGLDLITNVSSVASDLGGTHGHVISVTVATSTITATSNTSTTSTTQAATCSGFTCPDGYAFDASKASNRTRSTESCCVSQQDVGGASPKTLWIVAVLVLMGSVVQTIH
jgi:hypothetical protein